jgi:FlaA1/EpsC-like NDP-sugar epimerase
MENPVIILGAQAVGTAALDAFLSNEVVVYCLLDDEPKLHNTELLDVPVMAKSAKYSWLPKMPLAAAASPKCCAMSTR